MILLLFVYAHLFRPKKGASSRASEWRSSPYRFTYPSKILDQQRSFGTRRSSSGPCEQWRALLLHVNSHGSVALINFAFDIYASLQRTHLIRQSVRNPDRPKGLTTLTLVLATNVLRRTQVAVGAHNVENYPLQS